MRVTRVLAVTATAFAAVGLAPSLAAAGGGPTPSVPVNVTVNPRAVHQGATLQISAQGCNRGGRVWSNAFPTVELSAGRTGYATARVRYDTTPGHYNLSVRCNNSNNSSNGNGSGSNSGNNSGNGNNNSGGNNNDGNGNGNGFGSSNGNDAVATARFTVLDGRGAQGGLGGSMGPGSTETRVGGALVAAAAVGGAVFVVRRRRASNAPV